MFGYGRNEMILTFKQEFIELFVFCALVPRGQVLILYALMPRRHLLFPAEKGDQVRRQSAPKGTPLGYPHQC